MSIRLMRLAFRSALELLAVFVSVWIGLAVIAYAYDRIAASGDDMTARPSPMVAASPSVVVPAQPDVIGAGPRRQLLEREQEREAVVARVQESGRLTFAMCEWLTSHNSSTEQCERRQLEDLAYVIVEIVDEEHQAGRWVPLSRTKAPALLAAWSYHEVSWQWRRPPRGRSHGEIGAFQFHGVALDYVEPGFERDTAKAVRGAIRYMEYLNRICNGRGWGGAYISGECGGVPRSVSARFYQARWILNRMEQAR